MAHRQICLNQNVQVVAETVEILQLQALLEADSDHREICAGIAQQMSMGASSRLTSQDRAKVRVWESEKCVPEHSRQTW